jgi:hypothetical protein
MNDLSMTIKPKSDQLNADDLLAGSITATIENVTINSNQDQPISVFIGSGYQPYKPCKSMRRLLIAVWGKNDTDWIGKTLTIYNDQSVTWAGQAVGGIRVSHVSGITKPFNIALTATRGKRKPFTVQPIKIDQPDADIAEWLPKMKEAAKKGSDYLMSQFKSMPAAVQKKMNAYKRELWEEAKIVDVANKPAEPVEIDIQIDTKEPILDVDITNEEVDIDNF